MTTRPLHALAPALLMGCETTSTDDTTSSTEGDGRVELSLSLDGLTVGAGSCSNFKEVQSPARAVATETDPACGAAVELYDGSCWGVFPARPTFASLEVGAASAMLDPLLLVWSGSDPEASWDLATDQWRGSMEIVEWSDDRRVIDLLDGQRCGLGDEESCVATTGTLVVEGLPDDAYVAEAPSAAASWRDLDSGDLLCSSDLP